MKTKIAILKFLIAIISIGAAFESASSALIATSVYVRYTTADTTKLYCSYAGTCETSGLHPCTVRVEITNQPLIYYNGKATIPPNNNTCKTATTLNDISDAPINPFPIRLPSDAVLK